jgi:flavorubredoxin
MVHKKLAGRVGGVFGSFGWGGRAVAEIKGHMESLGWEIAEPVLEFRGNPTVQDFEKGKALAREVSKRIR